MSATKEQLEDHLRTKCAPCVLSGKCRRQELRKEALAKK